MSKQIIPRQTLDSEPANYLELWKWFTDDAGKIKEKMWVIEIKN